MEHLLSNFFIFRYLGKTLLLTILYILGGKLGLVFAAPLDHVSIIWPASGIAIGILLLFGWKIWPGILIGAFILELYIFHTLSPSGEFQFAQWMTASGIALGATFQALFAFALVRRTFGIPMVCRQSKDLAVLFLLCAPLASFVSPSIGVITLYFNQFITADAFLENWFLWWAGDTFGTLIFLPLVLFTSAQNPLIWQGRRLEALPIIAVLAILISLFITFYGWKLASENAHRQIQSEFDMLALENEIAFISRMHSYHYALLGSAGLFHGSEKVTRAEWQQYTDTINIATNFPGMHGIGLIQDIKSNEIKQFQEEMNKDYSENFFIHPNVNNNSYYIVTFIEPLENSLQALGLNIAFEKNRFDAANLARDSGQPTITKKISLIHGVIKTPGFLMLHPLYSVNRPVDTYEQKLAAFEGWVYTPIIAEKFFQNLTNSQKNRFSIKVYEQEENSKNLLFNNLEDNEKNHRAKFKFQKKIKVMQKEWLFVWESTLAYEQLYAKNYPNFVLAGGMIFTAFLSAFGLALTIKRQETLESLVEERKFFLPSLVFLIMAIGTFFLFNAMKESESNYVKNTLNQELKRIEKLISLQVNEKISPLDRLSQRLGKAYSNSIEQLALDVKNLTEGIAGLKDVEWVNPQYENIWQGIDSSSSVDHASIIDGFFVREVEKNISDLSPIMTPPLSLYNYEIFVVYVPVIIDQKFSGFLAGIFDVKDFFDGVLAEEFFENTALSLNFEDQSLFYNINNISIDEKLAADYKIDKRIKIMNQLWTLKLIPTENFLASHRTLFPFVILIAGFLIAALLALTLRYIVISKIKTNKLDRINSLNSAILLSAPSLIIVVDKKGKVLLFNKAAEKSLFYKAEEITGKHTPALWHDRFEMVQRALELSKDLGRIIEPDISVFTVIPFAKGSESREWTFIRKDGSRFPVNLTVSPLRDRNNNHTGFMGIAEDISEHKKYQEELKSSEETFRLAMEYASIGKALIDLKGHWLKINQELCRILGFSKAQLVNTNFKFLVYEEDLIPINKFTANILHGEIDSFKLEVRFYNKNEQLIWTLINIALVRHTDGVPNYLIVHIQDINDHKQVERVKNEFTNIMSHELRTSLTSIRGSLGLIVGALTEDLPKKVNRLIEIAYKNNERLILLINDILDIDKIISGEMIFNLKEESVQLLLQQAIDANMIFARKFSVTLKLETISPSWRIYVDAVRFIQCMSHLLSNAMKFSYENDTVLITLIKLENSIRICVKDSKPGISRDFQSRLFEKIFRFDASTRPSDREKGLGLYTSKQIVQRMGGVIGFHTDEINGATFWVEFPLVNASTPISIST